MLGKYGKDGLAVLGVTLDNPKEIKAHESVRTWLAQKKVPFRNVVLDVDPDKRPPSLRAVTQIGVPGAFVFNRSGQYVKKLPLIDAKDEPVEEMDYDTIEKVVAGEIKKR
jgi:hypothetical protein